MRRNARSTGLAIGLSAAAVLALAPLIALSQSSIRFHAAPGLKSEVSMKPAAGANGFVTRGFGPFGGQGVGVMGAPFSAVETTESITKFPDGNRMVQKSTIRHYRDSEGRTRTEHGFSMRLPVLTNGAAATPDGSQTEPTMVNINDVVKGQSFMLNAYDKSAQPMFSMNMERIQPPVPAPDPQLNLSTPNMGMGFGTMQDQGVKVTQLGEKTLEGVRVIGTRVENSIPAGMVGNERPITMMTEQWFSTELGVIVQSTQSSSTGTETIQKMEQIVRSEPDPSLFVVPAGYTTRERNFGAIQSFQLKKPDGN